MLSTSIKDYKTKVQARPVQNGHVCKVTSARAFSKVQLTPKVASNEVKG